MTQFKPFQYDPTWGNRSVNLLAPPRFARGGLVQGELAPAASGNADSDASGEATTSMSAEDYLNTGLAILRRQRAAEDRPSVPDPLSLLPPDAVLIDSPHDPLASLPPDAVILSAEEFLGDAGKPAPKGAENPSFASVRRGFSRFKQGAAGIAADTGILTPETAAKTIAEEQRYQQQIAAPQETQDAVRRMSEASSVADFLSALYKQPGALLTIMGESLGQGAPGMAAGALGAFGGPVGFGAAQGVASGATEYASSVLQSLADSGVDLADPKSVETGLGDPERMAMAREFALKRGVPVGLFDGLSAGLAGKITRLAGGPQSVRGAIGRRLGEMGMQAGAGAAGEAGAQLASEGRISKPGDVALEAVAEFPGGMVETGIGSRAHVRVREEAPPVRIEEAAQSMPEAEPVSFAPTRMVDNDFIGGTPPELRRAQAEVERWDEVLDSLHMLLNPIADGDGSAGARATRAPTPAERAEFERRWSAARNNYMAAHDRVDKLTAADETASARLMPASAPRSSGAGTQLRSGDRVRVINKKTGEAYEATMTGRRGPRTLGTRDDGRRFQPLTRAHRIERVAV
ncbi:hypothetical protein [Azospirillum palustre]